jgi:hypothetical protein
MVPSRNLLISITFFTVWEAAGWSDRREQEIAGKCEFVGVHSATLGIQMS